MIRLNPPVLLGYNQGTDRTDPVRAWRLKMKPSKKIPALLSGLLFSLIFSAAAFGPALYAQSNPGPESDSGT